MKHSLLFIFFLLIILETIAQNDTISPASFDEPCAMQIIPGLGMVPNLVTYINPDGGFVAGNSIYGIKTKAQKYYLNGADTLYAVVFRFGEKIQAPFPGLIKANVYNVNAATGAPNTLLASSQLFSVGNIDTSNNGIAGLSFDNPVALPDSFFVALDLTMLNPGDSVGLLSTIDSCFSGEQLAWEEDSSGVWHPFDDGTSVTSWGLSIDLAILPVLSNKPVGIKSIDQALNIYPNPANDFVHVQADRGKFRIWNLNGIQLLEQEILAPTTLVDLQHLKAATYLYELKRDDDVSYGKLLITR